MPNGGWVHLEGSPSRLGIKHPCMHVGEGISSRRDNSTLDLFRDYDCSNKGAVKTETSRLDQSS